MTQGGFGRLEAVVEGLDVYKGHKVKIMAKNEYFIVRYVKEGGDGAVMACTPDPICMVNLYTGIIMGSRCSYAVVNFSLFVSYHCYIKMQHDASYLVPQTDVHIQSSCIVTHLSIIDTFGLSFIERLSSLLGMV